MSAMPRLETDVVVVGGGGAGLAAAIEAAQARARVILLEKNPALGGTTRLSVGSVSACGTPHQRRQGIVDSPEAFMEDMALFNRQHGLDDARDNLELRRLVAERSASTVEWLMQMGVELFGPMPEPPNRHPRMHNVLPNASAYVYHLARRARRLGVRVMLGARAERLRRDGARVVGVAVRTARGEVVDITARRAVVLASGDYSSSVELKKRYLPPPVAEIEGINATSTGDGHAMALEMGARILNGDVCLGPEIRFVAPPRKRLVSRLPPFRPLARTMNAVASRLPARWLRPIILSFLTTYLAPSPRLFEEGAILVNREGRRFVDERTRPAPAIARQPDRVAYIVFDDRVARRFSEWPFFISTAPGIAYAYLADYRRNRRDVYAAAPTVDGLARALGLPAAALAATLAGYNALAEQGKPDAASGRAALGPGLTVPPFHALGPAKAWIVVTDGGLAVTNRMEVLDERGRVIPGLYAAGSAGQGGLLLEAHGMRLCWAFTSGRLAGANAATPSGRS